MKDEDAEREVRRWSASTRFGGPPQRPPWWPENEAWPPRGERGWGTMRHRMFRRLAFLFAAVVLLAVLGLGTLVGVAASLIGIGDFQFNLWWFLAAVVVLAASARAAGTMRRLATNLGAVIEATGRIESGDLAARVPVRGPGEVRALARSFNEMAARLEASERQRRTFLAETSHELRTPLTVIQGNLEAMLDGVHPMDAAHVRSILDETAVLARLIEDLRVIAQAEAGTLPLQKEAADLAELAREVAASFAAQAAQARVALEAPADADRLLLRIDPVRIRQVLSNLVANSLRHVREGGHVAIGVGLEPAGAVLSVTDDGRGIAEEDLPRIFDRFYRSPDSPGSGLGLAIAKSLVEAHGGRITADSGVGRGTRIEVLLPLEETPVG
ncbi:MAG: HAMP domain-containing histidine kinase [Chloroflexi bacterium]|nr:HAMP domain-containing histidine kinase [Chloroflexota bacterium]